MSRRARGTSARLIVPLSCALLLGSTLAGCSGDSTPATSGTPTASASLMPSSSDDPSASPAEGAAPPTDDGAPYVPPAGLATPSVEVTAQARGASASECTALKTVLANVADIGRKADNGEVAQADVDRAFGGDALAGVPADALPYVEATKTVAEKMPGMDLTAISTLFLEWSEAYNALNATVTKVCS